MASRSGDLVGVNGCRRDRAEQRHKEFCRATDRVGGRVAEAGGRVRDDRERKQAVGNTGNGKLHLRGGGRETVVNCCSCRVGPDGGEQNAEGTCWGRLKERDFPVLSLSPQKIRSGSSVRHTTTVQRYIKMNKTEDSDLAPQLSFPPQKYKHMADIPTTSPLFDQRPPEEGQ